MAWAIDQAGPVWEEQEQGEAREARVRPPTSQEVESEDTMEDSPTMEDSLAMDLRDPEVDFVTLQIQV